MSRAKQYYPIEDQINNCLKYLGVDMGNAHEMNEDMMITVETYLAQHFQWIDYPDYVQRVPQHYESGDIILEDSIATGKNIFQVE